MTDLHALSLQPFVPSGKDYDGSRRLFAELGFEEVWESGGYAGFRNGAAQFILQRFDDERFAGNFMVRLDVPDLDVWWAAVSQKQLEKSYPGFRIKLQQSSPIRVAARADDLMIVVAGGVGIKSAYLPTWGGTTRAASRAIRSGR